MDWELGSGMHMKLSQLRASHRALTSSAVCESSSPGRDGLVIRQCPSICAEFGFNLSTLHFGIS